MAAAPRPAPIIKRYASNPILTRDDVPYPVETVHNAGITRHDGRIIMLFRSHLRNGRSIIGIATSAVDYNFTVGQEPFMVPSTEGSFAEYESFGVEDPRICYLNGEYLITYSAYSRHGVRIGLAKTRDFRSVQRVSLISGSDMRNVVIFPACFDGRYARLDRPHSEISPWSVWLSWSPDLIYWGDSEVLMKPVQYHWDESKIGLGPSAWGMSSFKRCPYSMGNTLSWGAHRSSTGISANSGSRPSMCFMSAHPRSPSVRGIVRGHVSTTWSESGSSNTWWYASASTWVIPRFVVTLGPCRDKTLCRFMKYWPMSGACHVVQGRGAS